MKTSPWTGPALFEKPRPEPWDCEKHGHDTFGVLNSQGELVALICRECGESWKASFA